MCPAGILLGSAREESALVETAKSGLGRSVSLRGQGILRSFCRLESYEVMLEEYGK
jgi:hypothetical protein